MQVRRESMTRVERVKHPPGWYVGWGVDKWAVHGELWHDTLPYEKSIKVAVLDLVMTIPTDLVAGVGQRMSRDVYWLYEEVV